MKEDYRVGCSGYYYSYWKNRFYPQGVQPRDWLGYYSSIFPTVELNGTFYRTPKLTDLQRYASVTPVNFVFSVKISRYITHVLKMGSCSREIINFIDLIREGLGDKAGCFLFQFPPSFQYDHTNLERILASVPHESSSIVEFRHISWWNDEVVQALKDAGITFCNVDFPGLNTPFLFTSDTFYLRLHGVPELFKSSYSAERLTAFADQMPLCCKRYFVYFNNTYFEAGYTNALQMMQLLKEMKGV